MTAPTLVLTARDVAALLDPPACIAALERGLAAHESGHSLGPTSLGLTLPGGSFHVKAAALDTDGRSWIAAKANANLPGNRERSGRPTIQGALILLDAATGQPLAIMDSIVITSVRTGAVTAVAARRLAVAEACAVTIVGCGEQGDIQLRSLAEVRPLQRVFAIDVDEARARAYADRLSRELHMDIQATTDLAAAIAASQVLVTCTTSARAFVGAEHLHPGLFISAVGADNPGKHEISAAALRSGRVVVDSLSACAAGGDLHHAIAEGTMRTDDVHAELSAIVAGRAPGRSDDGDIFILDSVGTALQDVASAALVYTRALERGYGLHVDLGGR